MPGFHKCFLEQRGPLNIVAFKEALTFVLSSPNTLLKSHAKHAQSVLTPLKGFSLEL